MHYTKSDNEAQRGALHLRRACWIPLLLLVSVSGSACASHPKMEGGVPLEAKRGNWIDWTRFHQNGRQVDRGSVKSVLERVPESSSSASTASALETGSNLTRAAGVLLLAWGLSGAVGGSDVSDDTRNKLLIGGGIGMGASLGFALGADGLYVKAVDQYNGQLPPPLADE